MAILASLERKQAASPADQDAKSAMKIVTLKQELVLDVVLLALNVLVFHLSKALLRLLIESKVLQFISKGPLKLR
jgi:hypothetical protein